MITILRGSSGSGKSYTAYRLMQDFHAEPLLWPAMTPPNKNVRKAKILGYTLPGDLFLVGSYTARVCGGADCISGGPQVQFDFVERAARKFKHVFVESLMMAVSKDSLWADLKAHLEGIQTIQALTLNTPDDLSLQRIYDRNGGKPFNEAATHANWRRVHRKASHIEALGIPSAYVDYQSSYESVLAWLRYGGWNPEGAP